MDLANARACTERLAAAFLVIAADAGAEPLYLSPLMRAARRAADLERMSPRDPESRLVATATIENIERAQAPWRFADDEPTCSRFEAARALQRYIAGQGDAPGLPFELDLGPILARYNGPLGGSWVLETGTQEQRIMRRSALGEDELVARVDFLPNAIFLAGAHDDVAALLTEVMRLRTRLEDILAQGGE
jgi:hypothetical protein